MAEGGVGPPTAAVERVALGGAPLRVGATLRLEGDERPAGIEECGFELALMADQRADVWKQRRARSVAADDDQHRPIGRVLALDLDPMRTSAERPEHDHG